MFDDNKVTTCSLFKKIIDCTPYISTIDYGLYVRVKINHLFWLLGFCCLPLLVSSQQ